MNRNNNNTWQHFWRSGRRRHHYEVRSLSFSSTREDHSSNNRVFIVAPAFGRVIAQTHHNGGHKGWSQLAVATDNPCCHCSTLARPTDRCLTVITMAIAVSRAPHYVTLGFMIQSWSSLSSYGRHRCAHSSCYWKAQLVLIERHREPYKILRLFPNAVHHKYVHIKM